MSISKFIYLYKHRIGLYLPLVLLLTIASVLFLWRLGRDDLHDWDECIYAQYAKEMKTTKNILTYSWNTLPIYEKPPLYGWITQFPLLMSQSEFAYRLPSVIFAFVLLSALYVFGLEFFSPFVALISCLFLLSVPDVVTYMTRVNTDIGFGTFLFLALLFFALSLKQSMWNYLSGIFFGLSVLHKGLSTLFFMLPLFFLLALKPYRVYRKNILNTLIAFLLIILPWHSIQILIRGKEFFHVYFVEHLFTRYFYSIYPQKGFFFYVKTLVSQFSPWSFLFVFTPVVFWFSKKRLKNNTHAHVLVLLILTLFSPLLLFSLSQTRIVWYLLPLYPIAAIFLAWELEIVILIVKGRNLTYIFIFIASLSAFLTISKTTDIYRKEAIIEPSHEVFKMAKKYPQGKIFYLVEDWYRSIWQDPGVSKTIPAQFLYGQYPCVVFYSDKEVRFFYNRDEFRKNTNQNNVLYLIQRNNLDAIDGIPLKQVYRNTEYSLFTNSSGDGPQID